MTTNQGGYLYPPVKQSLYQKGDFVKYKGTENAMIEKVIFNPLGFYQYDILHLNTGKYRRSINALALELDTSFLNECDDVQENDSPIDIYQEISDEDIIIFSQENHECVAAETNDEKHISDNRVREVKPQPQQQNLQKVPKKKRFVKVTAEERRNIADKRLSECTRKSTSWGVGILQGNYTSRFIDLHN